MNAIYRYQQTKKDKSEFMRCDNITCTFLDVLVPLIAKYWMFLSNVPRRCFLAKHLYTKWMIGLNPFLKNTQ